MICMDFLFLQLNSYFSLRAATKELNAKIRKYIGSLAFSIVEFCDSFVFGLHYVYKLQFTDHPIQFELGVFVQKLLFFVVYCDPPQTLN